MKHEPSRTIELLVRTGGGSATGDELVTWAVDALSDGFDSSSLRRLAGVDLDERATLAATMPLFEQSLRELDLKLPEGKDALLRAFLRQLADEIVNGARDPRAALDLIHRYVLEPLGHPDDLMPWCFLWERLDPVTSASLDEDAVVRAAMTLAQRTVSR